MKKFIPVISVLVLISCFTQTDMMYHLSSISDSTNMQEEQPFAYVQLFRQNTNQVAIWNYQKYDRFVIYRKNSPLDSLLPHIWIDISQEDIRNPIHLIIVVQDTLNSELSNRYLVHPIVNNKELPALPIEYSTDDSTYYRLIEEE